MRQKEIFRHTSILLLAGISLAGIALFTPNAAGHWADNGSLFKTATSSVWGKPLQMAAACCSFKLVLLSLGLFLVIESLATILAVLKHKQLAWTVYFLHLIPCLGMLLGGYLLLKALL